MKIFSTILIFAVALATQAGQINNYEISALPAPELIRIDGDLAEWDTTRGIVITYDEQTYADRYSASVYMMYDRQNLYIAFDVKDPTPLINVVDPVLYPGLGWQSDSVKLHFWSRDGVGAKGPGLVTNLLAYYFSKTAKEACFIDHNDFSVVNNPTAGIANALGQGVELAFTPHADGNGYIQEMRIALENILPLGETVEPGDSIRGGIEVFWGTEEGMGFYRYTIADLLNRDYPKRKFFYRNKEAWGRITFVDEGKLPKVEKGPVLPLTTKFKEMFYTTEGPVELMYHLPEDGHVTLVIEDANGKRIRNLISDYPRGKGVNRDYWDGRDDNGSLVSDGTYQMRGIFHRGLGVEYAFSLQRTTEKSRWLSSMKRPLDVLADRKRIYVSNDGGTGIVALDYNGDVIWKNGDVPGGILAQSDLYLYVISDQISKEKGIKVYRLDLESGAMSPEADGKSEYTILDEYSTKYGRPGLHKDNVMGAAYAYGRLWISLYFDHLLVAVDPTTMELKNEYEFERPTALAVNRDGRLFAVRNKQLVQIDEDGKVIVVVKNGLRDPIAVAFDAVNNIYVTDWRGANQVKVYSPIGRLIRRIGKQGGRPDLGSFSRDAMLFPRGIAIDYNRRVWVVENTKNPKRLSIWNETGEFVYEFLALDTSVKTESFIDLDKPAEGYISSHRIDIDWEKGTWTVDKTFSENKFVKYKTTNYYQKYNNLFMNSDPMIFRGKNESVVWHYPNGHAENDAPDQVVKVKHGEIMAPGRAIGEALVGEKTVFCMNGKAGQAYLMTRDGLYVGSLFKDYRDAPDVMERDLKRGTELNNITAGRNWSAGQFFRNSEDGKIYITNAEDGIVVMEVQGLDSLEPIESLMVPFSKMMLQENADANVAEQELTQKEVGFNRIMLPAAKALEPGDDWVNSFYWDAEHVAEFNLNEKRSAKVSVAYDDRDLLLCYKVKDSTPLVNSFVNYRTLFRSGDVAVCDMRLADSDEQKPVKGDIRLLITAKNDKPIVVAMDYVVPGVKRPIIFTTSEGTQQIDRIRELVNARVEFVRTESDYTLFVRVPLEDINMKTQFDRRIPVDFGILYSDEEGRKNDGGMFWSGQKWETKTDIINLTKIKPGFWGRMTVE